MAHSISTQLRGLASLTQYIPKRASLVGAIILGVLAPAVTFAWGPANRDTYTMQHAATKPVFNSITNNPVQGDERNFMQVREVGQSNGTYVDSISLKPDTEYVMYIYYHNDANKALNGTNYNGKGVAHGAYVKADLPDYVNDGQTNVNAEGYVGAKNASEVFDEVTFSNKTGDDLSLSYVKGSATIHNEGKTDGRTLPDSIVTSGTKLGFDALDGTVPACSDYAGYVTFRVKTTAKKTATTASATPSFTVKKEVRLQGTTQWHDTVSAKPGDTVQYLATYTNTGSSSQKDIVVKDTLPAHVSYVKGSTTLTNGQNPSGKTVGDSTVTSKGLNIGDYAGGAVAYVLFDAKIANDVSCGTTTLTNGVTATSANVTKGDTAAVTVTKTCTTATPPATTTPPTVTSPPATTTTTPPATTTPTQTTPVTTAPVETTPTTTAPAETAPVTTTPSLPAPTPSTGPQSANLLGGAFGAGSLGLGAHHYLQSRRTLRAATK